MSEEYRGYQYIYPGQAMPGERLVTAADADRVVDELKERIRKLELEVKHWKVEWKIDRDSWSEASRKATKFEERWEYAMEILREIEWRGWHRNYPDPTCPYCGGEKEQGGHKEGCKLGDLLR